MSFSGKNGRFCTMLAMAAAAGIFSLAKARAGGQGEKIEFFESGAPIMTSNLTATLNPGLNRLNPTLSGFKQVEEDLFGPLKSSMHQAGSTEGVMSVPLLGPQQQQPRPVLSKHSKELLEQRRNWAFTDLNDLYPEPSMEEALGVKQLGDDGKEKKPLSAIEKYYERQNQKTGFSPNARPGEPGATGKQDFSGMNSFN